MSQCKQVYRSFSNSRGYTFVFCLKEHGHNGDHRGDRKQWTQQGDLVKPPTEALPK